MAYERGGNRGGRRGGNQSREAPQPTGELVVAMDRPGYRDRPDAQLRVYADSCEGHPYIGVRLWEPGL